MSRDYLLSRDMWDMIDDRIRELNAVNKRLMSEKKRCCDCEEGSDWSKSRALKAFETFGEMRRELLDYMLDKTQGTRFERAWEKSGVKMERWKYIYACQFERGLDFISRSIPLKRWESARNALKHSFPLLYRFHVELEMCVNADAWVREQQDIARVSQCVERLSTHMLATTSSHKLCESCMNQFEREIDEIRESRERALSYESVAPVDENTPHDTSRIIREPIKRYS